MQFAIRHPEDLKGTHTPQGKVVVILIPVSKKKKGKGKGKVIHNSEPRKIKQAGHDFPCAACAIYTKGLTLHATASQRRARNVMLILLSLSPFSAK